MKTEQAFANSRYRTTKDEDSSTIAIPQANNKRYRGWHVYWHGPDVLGLYWEGRYGCRKALKLLTQHGCQVLGNQAGDMDGIVLFSGGQPLGPFTKGAVRGKPLKPGGIAL